MTNSEKEVIDFYKNAFCADGVVKIVRVTPLKDFEVSSVIELNDSKRGKFYVARVIKKEDSDDKK